MIPATERCFQKGHFFTKLKTVSASACLLADAVDSEWGGNKIGLFFFFFMYTRMKWFCWRISFSKANFFE